MSKEIKGPEITTEPLGYVGTRKVVEVHSPEALDLVSVRYEDGRTDDFTNDQWLAVQSEEPYTDTDVAHRKFEKVARDVISLLVSERCTISDYAFVLQKVGDSLQESWKKSLATLYGTKYAEHVLLAEVHEVLKSSDQEGEE